MLTFIINFLIFMCAMYFFTRILGIVLRWWLLRKLKKAGHQTAENIFKNMHMKTNFEDIRNRTRGAANDNSSEHMVKCANCNNYIPESQAKVEGNTTTCSNLEACSKNKLS